MYYFRRDVREWLLINIVYAEVPSNHQLARTSLGAEVRALAGRIEIAIRAFNHFNNINP
jgi:hypothetical protein